MTEQIDRTARYDAMGVLGHRVEGTDAMSAFERAGLAGWNVRKVPMTAKIDTGKVFPPFIDVEVPGQYGIVRNRPGWDYPEVMSVVGDRYRVVQNEEHAEFLDAVVHESGGQYDRAMSLKGGRLVILSIKLPDALMIAGSDRVDQYVTAVNSHDGSTAFMLSLRQVRHACMNELPALRKSARFFAKHTQSLTGKVQQAREALGIIVRAAEENAMVAERMAATHMNAVQYSAALDRIFPPPANLTEERTRRAYERQREGLRDALHTPANKPIADTVWGGLNAVMEWTDHLRAVPGKSDDLREQRRAEQVLTSAPILRSKERANRVFREMAGAR